MSLMPAEPRSIGGVLDDAIRLYRRTLTACIPLVLIGVVLTLPAGLWLAMRSLELTATGDAAAVFSLFSSPLTWCVYLALVAVYAVIYGAVIHQIDAMARGRRPSLAEALGVGLKRLPVMFAVTLLFGIVVLIGMVLLVIPGIWLWGLLQLAFIAVIVDGSGVLGSFGTSRELMRGNWWRANIAIFVSWVLMIVLVAVLGGIGGVILGLTGAAEVANSMEAQVIQQLISAVLNVFTMSFFPCVLLAVFNDLKLRREGGDLLGRVGALSPAG